MSTTNI